MKTLIPGIVKWAGKEVDTSDGGGSGRFAGTISSGSSRPLRPTIRSSLIRILCNSGGSIRRAAITLTRFISAAFLQVCQSSSVWVHGYDGRVKRRSDWRYPPAGTCSGSLFEGRLAMSLLPLLANARKERSHFLLLEEDYWRIWKRSLLLLCWHLPVELNEM